MTATILDSWTRRPSASCCPRAFAGHRCTFPDCTCTRRRHVLDHARRWVTREGDHVLTSEPYDASGRELAEFLLELHSLDLRATVTGASRHNPGACFLILIRRNQTPKVTTP